MGKNNDETGSRECSVRSRVSFFLRLCLSACYIPVLYLNLVTFSSFSFQPDQASGETHLSFCSNYNPNGVMTTTNLPDIVEAYKNSENIVFMKLHSGQDYREWTIKKLQDTSMGVIAKLGSSDIGWICQKLQTAIESRHQAARYFGPSPSFESHAAFIGKLKAIREYALTCSTSIPNDLKEDTDDIASAEVICASVEDDEATLVDCDSTHVEGDTSLEEVDNLVFLDSLEAIVSRIEHVWKSKTQLSTAYACMHILMFLEVLI